MAKKHVLITGTGRAGTTFLVQLLTNLGLETGFSKDNMPIDKNARAGLENSLLNPDAPYIVKHPTFIFRAEETLNANIEIEHVFIPMRNLYEAAESRRKVSKEGLKQERFLDRILYKLNLKQIPGALTQTRSARKQEKVLITALYDALLRLSDRPIPVTLMQYPRLTKDCDYLYDKLRPILKEIDLDTFRSVYQQTVRPELVSSFKKR